VDRPPPLTLDPDPSSGFDAIVAVVSQIIVQFKELVEAHRLGRLFFNDDGSPRREKAAQLALFGIAESYCRANNLGHNPKVDTGNGPVDFKFSRGYEGRVLAEIMLSSSSRLHQGFSSQLEAYGKAERAYHNFYVVIRVDDTIRPTNELAQRVQELRAVGARCPDVVVLDARPRPSASRRRG